MNQADKFILNYEDWKIIHEMILFQRMLDPKMRRKLDELHTKVIYHMDYLEGVFSEDEEDKFYRRKIVK